MVKPLMVGSVCSGIGAPECGWRDLGWNSAFLSEIELFPRAVLSHHFPEVPLHGDFTTIQRGQYADIDLLVGGTPCQSFSVAGLRGGMADERGNLALEYLRLADRLRPRWLVWENVPGVLSSSGGRDFGAFLGGLGELGYGFAYRVLDAQHFGVAQRRRRVFVVGYLGNWRRAAAILFEPASLRRHPAPRREAGKGVAALTANGVGTCGADDNQAQAGHLIARCLTSHPSRSDGDTETFVTGTLCNNGKAAGSATNQDAENGFLVAGTICRDSFSGGPSGRPEGAAAGHFVPVSFPWQAGGTQDMPCVKDMCGTLVKKQTQAVAFAQNQRDEVREMEVAGTLAAEPSMKQQTYLHVASAVRRLTPTECERLQGFPDGWTAITHRKKPAADGPRYKALGNSMAVPVLTWIGKRIAMQEALQDPLAFL